MINAGGRKPPTPADSKFDFKSKVKSTMGEFKSGTLKGSTGEPVKDRKQAVAIALSSAKDAMSGTTPSARVSRRMGRMERRSGSGISKRAQVRQDRKMKTKGSDSTQTDRHNQS